MPKPTITVDVISSTSRRFGRTTTTVAEGARADVTPGVSIRLHGVDRCYASAYNLSPRQFASVPYDTPYDVTFRVGDTAVYGSYNLIYTGTITAIGAKTVTVREPYTNGRVHRMSLYDFHRRNYNLDLDRVRRLNTETMNCI